MTAMASTPAADPAAPDTWGRPLLEQQVAVLGRLAEAGLQMALALERTAKTIIADENEPTAEAAEAAARGFAVFGPVARAVRLSLMLQERLVKHLEWRDQVGETRAASAARDVQRAREHQAWERKVQVARIIERIAVRDGADHETLDRLANETIERLEQPDLVGDVLTRPISDLIAAICQDLGLAPDWPALAQEAWAREEIEGEAPGWPLSALPVSAQLAPSSAVRKASASLTKGPSPPAPEPLHSI